MKLRNIWESNVHDYFNKEELIYLTSIPNSKPDIQWLWGEMDIIWDENINKNSGVINFSEFYNHPIWILNGVFTSVDPLSLTHRIEIANAISEINNGKLKVCDYGGGYGVTASLIAKKNQSSSVDIYEPYSSRVFNPKVLEFNNIKYVSEINRSYDLILVQDVLEHLVNPIEELNKIASHIRLGGYLIAANCFYPLIKCHLESTFYLRHIFTVVMALKGFILVKKLKNASHVYIYKRIINLDLLNKIPLAAIQNFGKLIIYLRSILKKLL